MATITIDNFMDDLESVSKKLNENIIVTSAKESITEKLQRVEMSNDERDLILSNFAQQITLGLIGQAVEIVKTIPLLNEQQDKAAYDKLISLATLKKQYGYANATVDGLGSSTNNGVIDRQIDGFAKDMFYKVGKMSSENSGMLAQSDIETPVWLVNSIKAAISKMTDGQIIV